MATSVVKTRPAEPTTPTHVAQLGYTAGNQSARGPATESSMDRVATRERRMNEILYEKRGRVAYVTLNRPEALNALNTPLRQQLLESLRDFEADDESWVA